MVCQARVPTLGAVHKSNGFLITGGLYLVEIKEVDVSGAGIDAPSGVRFHICDKHGQCCTTNDFSDTERGNFTTYDVDPGDPCSEIKLDKYHPMEDGQTFEIEHFGSDGTTMDFVSFYMDGKTSISCWDSTSLDEHLYLTGGAGTRINMFCMSEIEFP